MHVQPLKDLLLTCCHLYNITVTEVFVDGVDSTVCVNVSVRNDATVNEARTIFLTLGSDNDLVFTGPPATITVLDDDG